MEDGSELSDTFPHGSKRALVIGVDHSSNGVLPHTLLYTALIVTSLSTLALAL